MTTSSTRRGLSGVAWAVLGGLVLLIGTAALIIASFDGDNSAPSAPPLSTSTGAPSIPKPTQDAGAVVDASVTERGWVPEPITTDAETYIEAALAGAGTFDTTKAHYEDWIAYLGTWFTPDTRYVVDADRQAELEAAKLEMRQSVVLPETEWNSLATESGRVESVIEDDVVLASVPQDASGDMAIGTANVRITFTRSDGSGGEVSYDEFVRLSVQVLCGEASIPTPGSGQAPGDCKIVRLISEPVEP